MAELDASESKRRKLDDSTNRASFQAWWDSGKAEGLTRVALLKAIEEATAAEFEASVLSEEKCEIMRAQMRRVCLESNMAGLEEFGTDWFTCIRAKMVRMVLCADWITYALETENRGGFDPFEKALITGAARMLHPYNAFYLDYLASVQDQEVVNALKANPPPATRTDIFNSYTVLGVSQGDAGGPPDFTVKPFAVHFASALGPVLAGFDEWLKECREAMSEYASDMVEGWTQELRQAYVDFLQLYRDCSASEDIEGLETMWTELDRKWMDTKAPIQLVHDIETGYGDPLRVKATPDMSLRFLDDTFAEENAQIKDIQGRMMEWFASRDTPLSRAGLTALGNTLAGIYFIPFKTGISLQFSFSGQSIPNRVEVKEEKGVKVRSLYFLVVVSSPR